MAFRDTDHEMIAAAMADRLARAVPPTMGECVRCGFPCIESHMDARRVCPECQSGEHEES